MEPLAGWTIAVTAERRADEQAQMLEARGARVVLAPLVVSRPAAEDVLRERTRLLLERPPDVVVANTATGMRSWIALAWSWGMGDPLLRVLAEVEILARGTKAAGALMSEGIDVRWLSRVETLDDVFAHLVASGRPGARVALQCDGRGAGRVAEPLRAAGFDVVELPIYAVGPAERGRRDRVELGGADAITFTSPAAVEAFASVRSDGGMADVDVGAVPCVCVGAVTAAAARRAGFVDVVQPNRARLGPMVRALAEHMAERALALELIGRPVRLQGCRLAVEGSDAVTLTPRERTLLEALVGAKGAVVSKQALADAAWAEPVEEHTVEVTVNRLRRKLGVVSGALETTNRRGYRLAMDVRPARSRPA